MTRRELLRWGGSSLLVAQLAPSRLWAATTTAGDATRRRLFFRPEDLPRIRANARTPLLSPLYQQWAASAPTVLTAAFEKFEASGDIIRDFATVLFEMEHSLVVQIVEPSPARQDSIINAIERLIARPHWDYFRDGSEVIGIQRASFATVRLLFAREVLGDAISPDLDKALLAAIAEKGCLPCYRTVQDMDHPELASGWDFDEQHAGFYDISMARWPMILGANNLRAAPTGALGLGAIALQGHDPRADEWLATAVGSTARFLQLFTADGSYFEGLSYLDYSLRTTLPFIEAHRRNIGDVNWLSQVNFDGMLDYVMTMQMGRTSAGDPDIVNFSDARRSVFPGSMSLIGEYTKNPLAGYAAQHAGHPYFFYDFLWYRPDAPSAPPRPALLNHRNDFNWIICRSGWQPDDAVLAFKSGGPANHEHADRNHLTFKAHGERLLNDHLGAAYDRRSDGWMMRLTRGHNAILLDGKGHTYVDGVEGTNDSQAYANILSYEDHGDHVWWTSDATPAYVIDNYHVNQVLRTVIYAKPGVIIIHDQIRFRYRAQTVDARFFPDNVDGLARLAVDGPRFTLSRPQAQLHGLVASDSAAAPRRAKLEVKPETGDFPCVEVHSPSALSHQVITVLTTTAGANSPAPEFSVSQNDAQWKVTVGDFAAEITPTSFAPTIRII
ncbi:heparinase II/III domain-containing protein [Synoicihabitans lomoniglobus]|uniref:Heparinase II/III family protein n=1 Tax=Synoicihabitans lomoniglobus TaxID=2909285 RepID=A0AAE9ZWA4_9BACT|nr:heparinase II/III family protein [Opitutaceae bacterium LMO-M01]WED64359.1 heparinase II/III family protein [Opitutaceae bacterium LMO-M01]